MLRISKNLQIAAVNAMGVPPGRHKEGLVIREEVVDRDDRIQKNTHMKSKSILSTSRCIQ